MTKNEAYIQYGETVPKFDGSYDFFYDETNNIRKLLLVDRDDNLGGILSNLNSDDNPFILGGIFTSKNLQSSEDFQQSLTDLFQCIGRQPTQKELKFKHVAKGGYPKILSSHKLEMIFKWMLGNEVYPHFQILDVYHWSLLDIVENEVAFQIYGAVVGHGIDIGFFSMAHLKAILVDIALLYKIDFFKDMYSVGFPNIDNENKEDFLNILLKYTKKYLERSKEKKNQSLVLITYSLILILEEYKKVKDDVFFLLRNPEYTLIAEFTHFYQNRIHSYPNSYHFFDEEKNVMSRIEEQWGSPENKNYEFVVSDENPLIQISDILLGFMRVLHNYLEQTDIEKIAIEYCALDEKARKNLALFFQLYANAVLESEGSFHYIGPIFNFIKLNMLKELALQRDK